MKQSWIPAIVFVIGCATGGVAAQLVVPPVRAGTAPTRWEYQCVESDKDVLTSTLNQFGAQGWELVSIAPRRTPGGAYVDRYALCSKRALP